MWTFLIVYDDGHEQLSAQRFPSIKGASIGAAEYLETCADNGDFPLIQIVAV